MKYLMGIDNGGTFSKAALFDEDGKQISVASVPTVTITPKPGYTERDMDELWRLMHRLYVMRSRRVISIQRTLQGFLSQDMEKVCTW